MQDHLGRRGRRGGHERPRGLRARGAHSRPRTTTRPARRHAGPASPPGHAGGLQFPHERVHRRGDAGAIAQARSHRGRLPRQGNARGRGYSRPAGDSVSQAERFPGGLALFGLFPNRGQSPARSLHQSPASGKRSRHRDGRVSASASGALHREEADGGGRLAIVRQRPAKSHFLRLRLLPAFDRHLGTLRRRWNGPQVLGPGRR